MEPSAPKPQRPGDTSHTDEKLKIYFLPNLLTGGNLFCGFVALTKIVQWEVNSGNYRDIKVALFFILLACIFDLFDGRVARMGGAESPFGREFDSLADIISFGVAPAFLVYRIVLWDVFSSHPELGWFIASIYLLCGAFRLARFNCLAAMAGTVRPWSRPHSGSRLTELTVVDPCSAAASISRAPGMTKSADEVKAPRSPWRRQPMYVASWCASGPGSSMQKLKACAN